MVGIASIETSDGKTERSHLYNSLSELAANSNLCFVLSFIIENEFSRVFESHPVFLIIKMA